MDKITFDKVWKALSDATRRDLLDLLRERPQTTGSLCAHFEHLTRFAVMKHLNILVEANLVVIRRKGRERWNYLNAVPLRGIYNRWVSQYQDKFAASMTQLKMTVEGTSRKEDRRLKEIVMDNMLVEQEVLIKDTPAKVFEAMTNDVSSWWHHRTRDDSKGVYLEPSVGGRFYEDYDGSGSGALYCTVTHVDPAKELYLSGPMGMVDPVIGNIKFLYEESGGGTLLKLSHHAIGEIGEERMKGYNQGWEELLQRLKGLIEG
jgi:DNA-binding transcriptional ArsR family regulator/uncharacterized protein YndB with AHSA1/START domain